MLSNSEIIYESIFEISKLLNFNEHTDFCTTRLELERSGIKKVYHLGERLKYFRMQAGLTQARLAELVGVSTHHTHRLSEDWPAEPEHIFQPVQGAGRAGRQLCHGRRRMDGAECVRLTKNGKSANSCIRTASADLNFSVSFIIL